LIIIALSLALYDMLTLELGLAAGIGILIGGGAAAGLLGAALRISPVAVRRAIFPGAIAVAVAGVFQELIQLMLQQYEDAIGDFREFIYTWEGLSPQGAITIFILVALCSEVIGSVWRRRAARVQTHDHRRERMILAGLALLVLVLLPALAGSYVGQVLMLVGLYILMGMGLNLEVGLAGLLATFFAFFAVGAYTALLTRRCVARAGIRPALRRRSPCSRGRGRRVVRLAALRARRLSGGGDAGSGRDCTGDRAIGFRLPVAWRCTGHPANSQATTGRVRFGQPGFAVLPDPRCICRRRICRLAAGELASRPRLDGAARR
jgi:hypothetical protein